MLFRSSVAVRQKLTTLSGLNLSREELSNIQKQPREQRMAMFDTYLGGSKIEAKVEVE